MPKAPVPPNLFMHIVVVSQASCLVQCLFLHGSISSGMGWGKEKHQWGPSWEGRLCPRGSQEDQLAIPARTTNSALQETSPARFLAVQVYTPLSDSAAPSTTSEHSLSSYTKLRWLLSSSSSPSWEWQRCQGCPVSLPTITHHPFHIKGIWITEGEYNPKPQQATEVR